jgi:hypothetical protein
MTPRMLAICMLLCSPPADAQYGHLDDWQLEAVTCCWVKGCKKLSDYAWRRTSYGVELKVSEEWCPVRLTRPKSFKIFNGEPVDTCDWVRCFVDTK